MCCRGLEDGWISKQWELIGHRSDVFPEVGLELGRFCEEARCEGSFWI